MFRYLNIFLPKSAKIRGQPNLFFKPLSTKVQAGDGVLEENILIQKEGQL